MSCDYKKTTLSLLDAVEMRTGAMIGAGENRTIGSSHLVLPNTGILTLIIHA